MKEFDEYPNLTETPYFNAKIQKNFISDINQRKKPDKNPTFSEVPGGVEPPFTVLQTGN